MGEDEGRGRSWRLRPESFRRHSVKRTSSTRFHVRAPEPGGQFQSASPFSSFQRFFLNVVKNALLPSGGPFYAGHPRRWSKRGPWPACGWSRTGGSAIHGRERRGRKSGPYQAAGSDLDPRLRSHSSERPKPTANGESEKIGALVTETAPEGRRPRGL